jgi:hypothetical protein
MDCKCGNWEEIKPDKYWFISYVRRKGNYESIILSTVLDFHPLKAINQWNQDSDFYTYDAISFQEISKEEYDLAPQE